MPALNVVSMRWEVHIKRMFDSNLHVIEGVSSQDLIKYEFVISHTAIFAYMKAIRDLVGELVKLSKSDEGLASHRPVANEVKIRTSIAYMYGQIIEHDKLVQDAWRVYKVAYEEYVCELGVDSQLKSIENYG